MMNLRDNPKVKELLRELTDEKLHQTYETFRAASQGRLGKLLMKTMHLRLLLFVAVSLWLFGSQVTLIICMVILPGYLFTFYVVSKMIVPAIEDEIARREKEERMKEFR